jgi:ferredoxin
MMNIHSVKVIFFSPTNTTERIIEGITQGLRGDVVEKVDLTPPEAETRTFAEIYAELAIIGAPVYNGRIPALAGRRLRRIKAKDAPAVVVCVYGNRDYEDALLELKDLAVELEFRPIAGGAFIGEHSFNSEDMPIAAGRPDRQDLAAAERFGELIREKLKKNPVLDDMPALWVPGDFPYKEWDLPSGISPLSSETLCNLCEICSSVCPTAAITVEETVRTDPDVCILCSACIKKCSTGARGWADPGIMLGRKWLSENCRARKEPEMYF